ncbi:calcium-binding protein [Nocardioides lacusdianchii]|uniref:calcium-binding protein n=1 Tax=Nocardioides lacusdianchii TaxID=2783664 RepID=UPI001CCD5632|nr:calcium-binding protein [Nocardioides lacusdianchii]
MRRTTSLTAAALVCLTAPGLALLGPTAASGAAETCQGRTATIVGSGHSIQGTEGPDVIVTNGARSVYAKGGDDLVCVTGRFLGKYYPVDVRAGDGNDVVDASGAGRQPVHASFGSGADTFVGGGGDDAVELDYPDAAGGVDTVDGRGGSDTISLQTGPGDVVVDNAIGHFTSGSEVRATWTKVEGFGIHQSAGSQRMTFVGTAADESVSTSSVDDAVLDVTLGRGDDRWSSATALTPTSRLVGGPGRDSIYMASVEAGIDLDMPAGTMAVAAPAAYVVTASDFEDADLFAPNVTVRGTDGPNDIGLTACAGVVRLGGGNDSVRRQYDSSYETDIRCAETLTANGGSGDDKLSGTRGDDTLKGGAGKDVLKGGFGDDRLVGGGGDDRLVGQADKDVLRGGKGRDTADGGTGRDQCAAERKQRCER